MAGKVLAETKGFGTKEEMQAAAAKGFETNSEMQAAYAKGFETKLEMEDSYVHGFNTKSELTDAQAKGFETKAEMQEIMASGFNTKAEMQAARTKGFNTKLELDSAKAKGFDSKEEIRAAMAINAEARAAAEMEVANTSGCATFLSISLRGLMNLRNQLARLPFFRDRGSVVSSNNIREYILCGHPHPARMFPDLFSVKSPVIALTYEWKLGFADIFDFLNLEQLARCSRKWNVKLPSDLDELTIWIDILFINQLSSNLTENLLEAESVYSTADFHLMLVTKTIFTRAWCLFELAVRKKAKKETLPVESLNGELSGHLSSSGNFFEGMVAANEGDLKLIRSKIVEAYGNFDLDLKPIFLAAGGTWTH